MASKIIRTGTLEATVHKISILETEYTKSKGGFFIILHMESKPVEEAGFEGLFIDKNDPAKGRYKGQIGRVKASQFAFVDNNWGSKEDWAKTFIKTLCINMGAKSFFTENEHLNYLELIEKINDEAVFSGKYTWFCVGASKYFVKDDEYAKYDLFLPIADKANKKYPISFNTDSLLKYDSSKHLIERDKLKRTESFNSPENGKNEGAIPIDDLPF